MQGKVAMRCGESYEKLATQIMETHKRGSLAKGMAVLDTDYVDKVPSAASRELLRLMLVEGRSQGEVCDEQGLTPAAVVEGVKGGVDELLALLETELT